MSRRLLAEHAFFGAIKAGMADHSVASDLDKAALLAATRFPAQARAAADPARFIAVRCPRRAGKSWFALSLAIEGCLKLSGASWVIVGLTRPSVKRIYWRLFKLLDKEMELDIHFKETELIAEFPNGSTISFLGAESRTEIEKLRGGAYHGVILDECKSYGSTVLRELIDDIIIPALGDYRGRLVLIGTPGAILKGPFYEATCEPAVDLGGGLMSNAKFTLVPDERPARFIWSLHTWSRMDNTAVPHLTQEALMVKEKNGWSDDNPTWRREYLGQWVAVDNLQVYRFKPWEHTYVPNRVPSSSEVWQRVGLPHAGPWHYCLGADIGFDDPFGLVLWAWSEADPCLYEVYSHGEPHLNVTGMAAATRDAHELIDGTPDVQVADRAGLAKVVLDELAETHSIYYEPAEKTAKNDHIELFNDDLDAGRIKVVRDSPLAEQLSTHQWDERTLDRTGKRVESRSTANDVADAGIYGFRAANHRRHRPTQMDTRTAEDILRAREDAEFNLVRDKYLQDKLDGSQMDRDWWN